MGMGVMRLFIPEEDPEMGHIAIVTQYLAEGDLMTVKLVTADRRAEHHVPVADKGNTWDWLQDMEVQVGFLEDDDDPESMTHYHAKVINWDLDKFLLCVKWLSVSDAPDEMLSVGRSAAASTRMSIGVTLRATMPGNSIGVITSHRCVSLPGGASSSSRRQDSAWDMRIRSASS